jgi:hypothetical protein
MFPSRPSAGFRTAVFIGLIPCFILTMLIVLGSARPARSAGNLQLGPVELHPSFEISEFFDDNICRTEAKICQDPQVSTKTKDGKDRITIFSPGLRAALPLREHRFQMEYRGDFGRYNEFKTENYSDNALKSDLAFNFPGGLSVMIKDDWKAGHDPRGYSQNVQVNFYHRNTAGAELGFRPGTKLRLVLNGSSMVLNYQDDSRNGFRDRTDNTLGGTVYYKFLRKTSALLEYDHTAVAFDEGDPGFGNQKLDSKVQRTYLGLTWDLTAQSQGTFKYGYIQKKFKEPGLTDFKGGVVAMNLSHELSTRTSVRLDAERDVNESNDPTQPYYISAGGHLNFIHFIRPKLAAHLQAGLFRDQYPNAMTVGTQTKKRLDDTWTAGAKLDYHARDWLNLGLGYDHSQRRSNIDGFGYIDHLYAFSLGVVL